MVLCGIDISQRLVQVSSDSSDSHCEILTLNIVIFLCLGHFAVWLAFRCYILTENCKEICAEIKCMLRSFRGHLLCKRLPLGIERPHWPFDVGLDSIEKRRLCALPSMHCISFCAIFSYTKPKRCVYCRCCTDLDWIHIVIYCTCSNPANNFKYKHKSNA